MKINFTTVKEFITILLFVKSIVACSTDDLLSDTTSTPITKSGTGIPAITEIYTDSTKNGAIVLDNKPVGNPFNVDTLKKAYTLLYPNGRGRSATPEFTPTHYQLRFLPADSLEFRNLMTSGLVLTTVPLDKRITEEGTYYFDPQLAAQHAPYTWQYTIVPVTQELPNIRHEVMAEICAGPNDGSKGRSVDGVSDIWPALETKAYEMCGEEAPPKAESRIGGQPGMPGENLKRIYVWDDKANQYIPAKGAKVVAFGHIFGATAYTDNTGSYDKGMFKLIPLDDIYRIEIVWEGEDDDWRIFDGAYEDDARNQAIYACPFAKNRWTFRIKGGKQQTFAVATRALDMVYHPPMSFTSQLIMPSGYYLKFICIDNNLAASNGNYSSRKNRINVWGKESGYYRLTHKLFATVAHELGHMFHHMRLASSTRTYNNSDKIIKESWARFVQSYLTEYEYNELSYVLGCSDLLTFVEKQTLPGFGNSGYPGLPPAPVVYNKPNWDNYQDWPYLDPVTFKIKKDHLDFLAYSPLFIDLIDSDNQYAYYRSLGIQEKWPSWGYKNYPNDPVSGYPLVKMEFALRTATNLTQLRENLKNEHAMSEADKVKIDTLFNRYIYYWEK